MLNERETIEMFPLKSWHERGREIEQKRRKREHHNGRQKKQMNIKDTKRALERKIELKRKRKRLIKNDNAQK